jgi:acyl-coenzyme A synthetase/AMP-(fatty) acid ligase
MTQMSGVRTVEPTVSTLAHRFAQVAERLGGAVWLRTEDRCVTFADLAGDAGAVARRLGGLDADGPVAIIARDAVEASIGLLGAWGAGRAASIVDPAKEQQTIAGLRAHFPLAARIGGTPTVHPDVPHISFDAPPVRYSPIDAPRGTIALHATTSGSTAAPKPLSIRARWWADLVDGPDWPGRPRHDDVLFGPFARIGVGLVPPLVAAMLGTSAWSFDPSRIALGSVLGRAAEVGATHLTIVPSLLRRILTASRTDGTRPRLRVVSCSGEPLTGEDVLAIRAVLGDEVTVVQRYGSTECGPISGHAIGPETTPEPGPLPVGRPIPGIEVRIVDGHESPVPAGSIGRIEVTGRLIGTGFQVTELPDGRERFVTSDLGLVDDDGLLWIKGRDDRMVKIGGVRVEPGAVEGVLRSVPGVLEVAVVPTPIADGDLRLVAHVVIRPGAAATVDDLRQAALGPLSSMAVPARFVMRTDPLPLLPNGKIDRRALIDLLAPQP